MIYDCFTFFNELDLLEIRLNILDNVVDKFVLVEATKNHQGKMKSLFFKENKNRFEKFLPKIIHIVVDDYPANPGNDAWVIERHQRNCIIRGLKDAKQDDVILVSDLDEIPDPQKIKNHAADPGLKVFRQRMFYYFLNCVNTTSVSGGIYDWSGTVMGKLCDVKKDIQQFREVSIIVGGWFLKNPLKRIYARWKGKKRLEKAGEEITFINEGGWHFSYLGGVERIIHKLESFAHTEYNTPEYKDPERIRQALEKGEDIFGRGFRYKFVPVDESYPEYIRSHREELKHLIHS